MRVLIVMKNKKNRVLVHLHTEDLITRVRDMITRRDLSKAIDVVLDEGIEIQNIAFSEVYKCDADLILTEDFVRWDLLK